MTIFKESLGELLKGCERPEDLLGDAGLMKEPEIKLMERHCRVILSCPKGWKGSVGSGRQLVCMLGPKVEGIGSGVSIGTY